MSLYQITAENMNRIEDPKKLVSVIISAYQLMVLPYIIF